MEEGDYGGLIGVMGHLLAVKERQNTTDAMFEPLQQTIALLKVYEQELPDVVHKQLVVSTDVQSLQIPFTCTFSFLCCFQLRQSHLSNIFLCLPTTHLCSLLSLLAIHHLLTLLLCFYPFLFISLFHCLPVYLSVSAGTAREVEQCEKAGCLSQAGGGASAGDRGGQPASKVRLV